MLTGRAVDRNLKEYRQVIDLYERNFPENERIATKTLLAKAEQACMHFMACYDDDVFVGFIFASVSDEAVFIVYIVVEESLRAKGYGSRILQTLKARCSPRAVMLNIEPVEKGTENYEQRLKRLRFYEGNGFHETGYRLTDETGEYSILSTVIPFQEKAYRSAVDQLIKSSYEYEVKPSNQTTELR